MPPLAGITLAGSSTSPGQLGGVFQHQVVGAVRVVRLRGCAGVFRARGCDGCRADRARRCRSASSRSASSPGNGSPGRRMMVFVENREVGVERPEHRRWPGRSGGRSPRSDRGWSGAAPPSADTRAGTARGIQLFSARFTPLSVACESAGALGRAGCHHVTGISVTPPGSAGLNRQAVDLVAHLALALLAGQAAEREPAVASRRQRRRGRRSASGRSPQRQTPAGISFAAREWCPAACRARLAAVVRHAQRRVHG